jgi:cytochrome c peroxidase
VKIFAKRLWFVRFAFLLGACDANVHSADDVAAELASEANAVSTAGVTGATEGDGSAPPIGVNPRLLRRFKPLREALVAEGDVTTTAQVDLGRMLYFETRLSKNHDVSCNSCHKLDAYGVDGERTSLGHRQQRGTRNSPTVYNAAGHFAQFWDGRADTIEAQATAPMVNPLEMALASPAAAENVLRSIPEYRTRFAAAFPGDAEPVSAANIGKALGAFERGLLTPSRWDDYLKGNKRALTTQEVEGLAVFTGVGCMVCHTGEFLGGSMFEKAGVVEDWPNQADQGRYDVSSNPGDRMMFKVPTLRNVEKTAPYFHDGSAATLDDAVRMMGRHQLGLELTQRERASIVAWLRSLTGELPHEYVRAPALPAASAETPRPDPT